MSCDEETASPSWKARLLKFLPRFRSETVDEQPEDGTHSLLCVTIHRSQVFPGSPPNGSQDVPDTADKDALQTASPISQTCTYSVNTSRSVRTFINRAFDFGACFLEIVTMLMVIFGVAVASHRGLTFIHQLCLALNNA